MIYFIVAFICLWAGGVIGIMIGFFKGAKHIENRLRGIYWLLSKRDNDKPEGAVNG